MGPPLEPAAVCRQRTVMPRRGNRIACGLSASAKIQYRRRGSGFWMINPKTAPLNRSIAVRPMAVDRHLRQRFLSRKLH
jgi:hypothetical protein